MSEQVVQRVVRETITERDDQGEIVKETETTTVYRIQQ